MWPNRKCKKGNPAALQQWRKSEKERMQGKGGKRERPRLKLHVLMDTAVYRERENDKDSEETRPRGKIQS